jgi:hypothetical protein
MGWLISFFIYFLAVLLVMRFVYVAGQASKRMDEEWLRHGDNGETDGYSKD